MTDPTGTETETVDAPWRRAAPTAVADPFVRRGPYVELKLTHPDLAAGQFGSSFVPDAVPYETDSEQRVVYWRSALADERVPDDPAGFCATTHELCAIPNDEACQPTLSEGSADAHRVVVDGTIAGESTLASVRNYEPPTVRVEAVDPSVVTLAVPGGTRTVAAGCRQELSLPSQTVVPREEASETTVTPQLAVRYPGERVLYHPAPEASYRLFPGFGLDLDWVPDPVAVPTTGGELDHGRLAATLDVDLAARPYPERVLWQAFAYAAFDPHDDGEPTLAQFPSGLLAVCPSAD